MSARVGGSSNSVSARVGGSTNSMFARVGSLLLLSGADSKSNSITQAIEFAPVLTLCPHELVVVPTLCPHELVAVLAPCSHELEVY